MELSAVISETPELKFNRAWAVAGCAAHSVVPSEQVAPPRLPALTETGVLDEPLQKSVSPATEVIIGIWPLGLYWPLIRSAMRPAQPVEVAPDCDAFCHSNCWSECENRLVGTVDPARY